LKVSSTPFAAWGAIRSLSCGNAYACISIGANTTVFSIANSILIRPPPCPKAERIDWISERSGPAQEDIGVAQDYYRVREWNRIFEDTAAFNATR